MITITVAKGDGIGPEIMDATLEKSIEAFNELSKSTNSKTIITDGKAHFLIE
jgi:isocitrate/isopropylmalate dehydrogenase